ncbi:MAG: hypothetical protein HFI12_06860 [Lachnospiraceae bacterium]|jgi:hypothetical protein|nr:hypothetical protein [Lachnospiraceae bacterium]
MKWDKRKKNLWNYLKENRQIRQSLLLAAFALVLTVCASAKTAMAYFTTYASAGGRAQISLGFTRTETEDTVSDWTKHIAVANSGEQECYARVKVLVGEQYKDSLLYTAEDGWRLEDTDGYWYYNKILAPQEKTSELLVKLERSMLSGMTQAEEQKVFNVIVVPEYTAVLYDEDGNPYADWSLTVAGEVE